MTLKHAVEILNKHRHRTWSTWRIEGAADGRWTVVLRSDAPGGAMALLAEFEAIAIAERYLGGWIPAGERLPEPFALVQVWSPSRGIVQTGYLPHGDACWRVHPGGYLGREQVTHWAPLLAPPDTWHGDKSKPTELRQVEHMPE